MRTLNTVSAPLSVVSVSNLTTRKGGKRNGMELKKLDEGLFWPDYENSIVNFSNSILELFDEKPLHRPFNFPKRVLENVRKVIVMVVDGLSFEIFSDMIHDDDVLVFPCSSVFPTTTAAALPSLYSALTPLEHGFLGYILYLREVGSLVNMIEMSPPGLLRDSVLRFHDFRFITIFQRLQDKVKNFFLVPRYLLGTGFSRIMSRGSEQIGFSSFGDMIEKTLEILENPDRTLVFIYWPTLDSIAHKNGVGREYIRELRWIYRILKFELLRRLKQDTLFFLVSDHGQISTPQDNEIWWDFSSEVMRFLDRPPTGEQRMMFLYTKKKRALIEYLKEKYGDFAVFLDPKDFVHLFGTGRKHSEFFSRVGDAVLITKETFSFNYRYTGKEESLSGRHGSLSYQELVVPLVVYRRW